MSHTIKLTVTIELERIEGKFASRDEMTEALIDELEGMDPGEIYGLGADGDTSYSIANWEVGEA